jgi:hypothetical protein
VTGNDIASIIQSVGLLITACTSAAALIQSIRNGKKSARIEENVATIEKATNSMKDALVAATAKAATAEGKAIGLEQGRTETRPSK